MLTFVTSLRRTLADREARARAWLTTRQRFEYVLFRAAVAIVRAVPLDTIAPIAAILSREFWIRNKRHRRALANIAKAMPELSPERREAIIRSMWENVGRVIAEAAHAHRFIAEPNRLDPVDMEILDGYAETRGLYLIVSLHTGNWEIALLRQMLLGFQPAAFYRIVENPLVDDYIRQARKRIIPGGLFAVRNTRDGRSSVDSTSRAMVSCLRQGLPIGVLADHRDHDGINVTFFGQEVRVSRVPVTLALQFNAPLCVGRTIRIGRQSRFIGDGVVIDIPRTADRHADIQAATAAIFRQFEIWIRQYPDQWLWSQAPFVTSAEVYAQT
jgi:KDO2-lipid IV(A) lauroyltransferase